MSAVMQRSAGRRHWLTKTKESLWVEERLMEGEVDENEDGEIRLECVYELRPWVEKA